MFFLAKSAREHVTVALSGDGADELFAGYDTYLADKFQRLYMRIPQFIHDYIVQPMAYVVRSSDRKVSLGFKMKQFVANAYQSPEQAHFGWRLMFTDAERVKLTGWVPLSMSTPFLAYAQHHDPVRKASWLNQSLYVDVKTWLVDDILTKVDRASMAVSLEARVPFLSPRVVEFAMQLPTHLKLKGLTRKYLLRRLMHTRLPPMTIRRRKSGFNAPINIWMKTRLCADIEMLFHTKSSSIIDLENPMLKQLWEEHTTGRADHGFKLWTLLSLLLWEQSVFRVVRQAY
jgi:asparagine synthase (glutamine-hydrolysing)